MVDWTLEAIEAAHCAMFQEPYDGTTAVMIGAGLDAAAAAQGMETENALREENARLAALASQASLEASQLREALKPIDDDAGTELARLRAKRDAAMAELEVQKEYNAILQCKRLGPAARSAERYWEARSILATKVRPPFDDDLAGKPYAAKDRQPEPGGLGRVGQVEGRGEDGGA